jgi:hypothetical protein
VLLALVVLFSSCAPSLESVYKPFFETHEWVFSAERTGLGSAYKNVIRISSQPVSANESLLRVHVFPDDTDPRVGARHTYKLIWTEAAPRLVALTTQAGIGTLEPGLPLPDFGNSSGSGQASYAPNSGLYGGQRFTYSWRYTPDPSLGSRRADLELRSSLKLTDSNIRLEFASGVGVKSAEWKTVYGVSVVFKLESFK